MNPMKPFGAIIKKTRHETADVKTMTLELQGDLLGDPRPGQFTMLGYPGAGEAPISFSALKENGCIEHTVRAVGTATHFLDKMDEGDMLLVRGPFGNGWPMKTAQGRDLVLVAGGLGLAPLRPVIREVLAKRDFFGKVTLLYGARNEGNLLFTDEYSSWQAGIALQLTVDELVTGVPWHASTGLITGLLDRVKVDSGRTIAFVVGPELMMRFVCRGLELKGVRSSDIYVSLERRMKCGIAQCGHCQHVGLFVCKDGPVFPYARVSGMMDGLL